MTKFSLLKAMQVVTERFTLGAYLSCVRSLPELTATFSLVTITK